MVWGSLEASSFPLCVGNWGTGAGPEFVQVGSGCAQNPEIPQTYLRKSSAGQCVAN